MQADPHLRTVLGPCGFLPADRQVTDHHMHRRPHLLGLRREASAEGFWVGEKRTTIECHPCAPANVDRAGDS